MPGTLHVICMRPRHPGPALHVYPHVDGKCRDNVVYHAAKVKTRLGCDRAVGARETAALNLGCDSAELRCLHALAPE
jgi:hypothetical protein